MLLGFGGCCMRLGGQGGKWRNFSPPLLLGVRFCFCLFVFFFCYFSKPSPEMLGVGCIGDVDRGVPAGTEI